MSKFEKGDRVVCINAGVLAKSGNKPSLALGAEYTVQEVYTTIDNNEQHLDVGIAREYDVITDYKSGKRLPDGPGWCHSSRFEKK